MKKLAFLALSVLLIYVPAACTTEPSHPDDGMIYPGDRIDNFLITTGETDDVSFLYELACDEQAIDVEPCTATVGTKVVVSFGFFRDAASGRDMETVWAEHTYEMRIAGQLVNIQAFGSIDNSHPVVGTIRFWNVVITTDIPGEITIENHGTTGGEPFTEPTTIRLIFEEP